MIVPEYLRTAREFAATELIGQESFFDSLPSAPVPQCGRFADTGLMNWWLPKEVGGLGLNLEEGVQIVSALAYGDAGVAFTLFLPILTTGMIMNYGTPELQQQFLAPLAATHGFAATLGSEHEAGSELARITTTFRRDGSDVVIDGLKAFSTNTDFAEFLVVIARNADDPSDYAAIVVPRATPGIEILRRWDVAGLRASATYEVQLTGCRVPASHVLQGNGLRLLEVGLNASRIFIAATGLGIARRVRDLCMDYGKRKMLKGSPLVTNALFASRLGQFEMQIDVMANQCLAAARAYDAIADQPDAGAAFLRAGTLKSALTTKMFCGQQGFDIASEASQMMGGVGYTSDAIIGKLLRDVRYVSIVEGGDDVLRELVFNRYVMPASKRS